MHNGVFPMFRAGLEIKLLLLRKLHDPTVNRVNPCLGFALKTPGFVSNKLHLRCSPKKPMLP